MSDTNQIVGRVIPTAKRPTAEGPFEVAMAIGTKLPGKLGYIARRKLKRRQCARAQDTFSEVLADTRKGDLCIDLGANVGEFSLRMAATGADVISFEPDPGAYSVLKDAVSDKANITLIHKAAGHQNDTLVLHRSDKWSENDPGANTKSSSLLAQNQRTADENSVQVEVVDLSLIHI